MKKLVRLIFCCSLALLFCFPAFSQYDSPTPPTAPSATSASPDAALAKEGEQWWSHIQYLADDKLEGRLTGSEGYRKAAAYVADHFKQYGLEPAGTEGYFQPVKFDVQRVIASESKLALKSGGFRKPVPLGGKGLAWGPPP